MGEPLGGHHQGSMTSLALPTPEALGLTVPHFSLAALGHLIGQISPLLPPPPQRGPKGMPIVERVQLALAHLREGVSLRGLARIKGIPPTTLRDNRNPVLAAFDQLDPVLPDGSPIEDFDDVIAWCACHSGTVIVDGTEFGTEKPSDDPPRPTTTTALEAVSFRGSPNETGQRNRRPGPNMTRTHVRCTVDGDGHRP